MIKDYTCMPPKMAQNVFLEDLYNKIKVADGDEFARLYYCYMNFCNNLNIKSRYIGVVLRANIDKISDKLRNDVLSDIEMTNAVCCSREAVSSSTILNNNVSQSQTQEQHQQQTLNVVGEALRRSLTGEQFDEVKELVDNNADRKTILDKIKSFGTNVAEGTLANVLSSLITNGIGLF